MEFIPNADIASDMFARYVAVAALAAEHLIAQLYCKLSRYSGKMYLLCPTLLQICYCYEK